jgi:hypothetical protein
MRHLLVFALLASSLAANAQLNRPAQAGGTSILIERSEGTAVTVSLGYGITLNKESALRREWFVVRDAQSPAVLDGASGVNVVYKSGDRSSRGEYQYSIPYRISPKEPITAFEVRVIVIDVFGRLVKTLSSTELINLSEPRSFEGTWRIFSENEASEAFASVAYVAQVRTAAGRVYVTDRSAVFEQVRRVASRLTEADLEPKRDAPQR